jgi:hypothetical protein
MGGKRLVTSAFYLGAIASNAVAGLNVQSLGVNGNGNLTWAVIVDPAAYSPANKAVAVEVGLAVYGSTIVGASFNNTLWTHSNPGTTIFGWEQATDLGSGNLQPVGVQWRNGTGPPQTVNIALTATTTYKTADRPFAPVLTGDYDEDGDVDDSDYTEWRSKFGTIQLNADGNGDGVVDAADFTVWGNNFGMVAGAGAGSLDGVSEDAALKPNVSDQLSFSPSPDAAIFAALGTKDILSANPVELLRFETLGTAATTVEWGGAYGAGMRARLAQNGINDDTSMGAVMSAIPEPSALLALMVAATLSGLCTAVSTARKRCVTS